MTTWTTTDTAMRFGVLLDHEDAGGDPFLIALFASAVAAEDFVIEARDGDTSYRVVELDAGTSSLRVTYRDDSVTRDEGSHEGEQLTLSPAESDSMWDNYGG